VRFVGNHLRVELREVGLKVLDFCRRFRTLGLRGAHFVCTSTLRNARTIFYSLSELLYFRQRPQERYSTWVKKSLISMNFEQWDCLEGVAYCMRVSRNDYCCRSLSNRLVGCQGEARQGLSLYRERILERNDKCVNGLWTVLFEIVGLGKHRRLYRVRERARRRGSGLHDSRIRE
jgi:hypothetical protein